MPFAIRNAKGEFLRVVGSSGGRKRRWVQGSDGATWWQQRGHAASALVCAVENRHISPHEVVEIVRLEFQLIEHEVERVTTRLFGRYKTHRKVVSLSDRGESKDE